MTHILLLIGLLVQKFLLQSCFCNLIDLGCVSYFCCVFGNLGKLTMYFRLSFLHFFLPLYLCLSFKLFSCKFALLIKNFIFSFLSAILSSVSFLIHSLCCFFSVCLGPFLRFYVDCFFFLLFVFIYLHLRSILQGL